MSAPAFPPNRIIREGRDPIDKPAPLVGERPSFVVSAKLSLIADSIAQLLYAAAVSSSAPADLPLWNDAPAEAREMFRRKAYVAVLQGLPVPEALARARVRLAHGRGGERALKAYATELLKLAPITGGK